MPGRRFGVTAWGHAWLRTIERTTGQPDLRLPRARALSQRHVPRLALGAQSIIGTIADGSTEHVVRIRVGAWADAEQATAEALLARESDHLGAGEVPDQLVDKFTAAGLCVAVPLDDIEAVCTCRSRTTPCTHTLATLYGVVLRIDERPLTALDLRMRQSPARRGQDCDWLALADLDPSTFFTRSVQRFDPNTAGPQEVSTPS
jgi:uncharacterized Zn finger protein